MVIAPDAVTPEMLRLLPEAILKMLKLRVDTLLLPLMVSKEAPRPLMVRVPMLVFKIVGSAAPEVRTMV